jgi:hypothetical protein
VPTQQVFRRFPRARFDGPPIAAEHELDRYVFEQVRQALLDPQQLIAAERALIAGAPDENELVATQLGRLDSAIDTNGRERTRLLDGYQAGLIELGELTRRTATLTTRRDRLRQEKDALTKRSAELASENRLRRRLAGFAERVTASLDELDFEGRQRLLRLVVEKVRVTGWRVEIHLKIPLADEPPPDDYRPNDGPPNDDPRGPGTGRAQALSSDIRLRSAGVDDVRLVRDAVNDGFREPRVREHFGPVAERQVGGHDQRAAFVAF